MLFQSLYNQAFAGANLEKIAEQYPYFSVAHYFRLQQQQAAGNVSEDTAAKAALHFANPYLLQHQLTATAIIAEERPLPETMEAAPPADKPVSEITATRENESFDHRVEVEETPVEVINESSSESITADSHTKEPEVPVTKAAKDDQAPLLFEPLHTTDYFASQGIKLSEVVLSGDKVGRQLKSFTEWLKTMKKVHPEGVKEKKGFIDPSVQKMADKSNAEEEVITESMADVYIQQGKTNKAKEIYEKLSLLNPSKSAYFAAKLSEIQ